MPLTRGFLFTRKIHTALCRTRFILLFIFLKKEEIIMLENKVKGFIHYSRFIASWRNARGKYFSEEFEEWLKSEGLSEEEVREVVEMATCGKLELETSAKNFVAKEHRNESVDKAIKRSGLADVIRKMKF
jgi:hypothetical protein